MSNPDFKLFSKPFYDRFVEMSKDELYVVDIGGDALVEAYLNAFPPGTNEIFRTRREYDCSCCKNVIRNVGGVVQIKDGQVFTVWNLPGLPGPFAEVAAAMHELVSKASVRTIFRTKEPKYGAESTLELLEDKTVRKWQHFHVQIAKRHLTPTPEKVRGEFDTATHVFRRGLEELTNESLETIADLIASKNLYRGEEHEHAVKGFRALSDGYWKIKGKQARSIYVLENAKKPGAGFRNTVIGTLAIALSEGEELEKAVKSFEAKVAPANYKRPTALITPKMIDAAMATITDLGLRDALERRMAKISDVSVNNVLWVDNDERSKMRDSLVDSLLGSTRVKPSKSADPGAVEDISIEDFMSKVLPKATSMELRVENRHWNNFVTLTAPVHPGSGKLFQWDNEFAWAYDGEVADSLREVVAARGGRVTGPFRFSHQWNYRERNASLMDLHVFMPGSSMHANNVVNDEYGTGRRIGWNQRGDHLSGGTQDVDYTDAAPVGYVPVENISFPDIRKMPEGRYVCKIHNWSLRQPTEGGFKAEIELNGVVYQYERVEPLKHKEWVTVAEVQLKGGQFTIKHHMEPGLSSQAKWGVKTESFVKVRTVMLSPNFWDDQKVGNKHHFFILDGCKNPESVRGVFNEFLAPGLNTHRKVFEVIGSKTKCPAADEQLSGVGFSSTRGDTVKLAVTGERGVRHYNVKF